MTGWGKVVFFLLYVTINEIGNYLDQDSKYYTCPCYCEVKHEHIKRENDRCKQTFQMVIQDSSALYAIHNDDIYRMDGSSYSESFSEKLSRMDSSLTK